MGVHGLLTYVKRHHLYDEVNIKDIADDVRRERIGEPEIAVDGSQCVWYLYGASDFLCGGQYKEFRNACRNFVEQFRDCGVRLIFFFDGVPIEEKMETWCMRRQEKIEKIKELFSELRSESYLSTGGSRNKLRILPEAMVPMATSIFKYDLSCEVHLSSIDCDTELAQYAASKKSCIGILSNDSDFLVHEGLPCLMTFDSLDRSRGLKARRFLNVRLASKMNLQPKDLPVFASFVGNDIVSSDYLRSAHFKLKRRYNDNNFIENAARLVREGPPENIENMCKIAFGADWKQGLEMVKSSIRSYVYTERGHPAKKSIDYRSWDGVLYYAEAKSVAAEMPGVILSIMKCRIFRNGEALEDLSLDRPNSPPTGSVLRQLRARMYTVLLWECTDWSCYVREYIPLAIGKVGWKKVQVTKSLPTGVSHPGLVALWTGLTENNWRLFSWIVSPQLDASALRSLSPKHLVVPAAALLYLRHEVHRRVIRSIEAETLAAVAVCVGSYSAKELAEIDVVKVDERAVYLSSLYVRTMLHILDAAGTCGLSFPRPQDCHLEAYFDGRLFHHFYLKMQMGFDFKTLKYWSPLYDTQFQQLQKFIKGPIRPNI